MNFDLKKCCKAIVVTLLQFVWVLSPSAASAQTARANPWQMVVSNKQCPKGASLSSYIDKAIAKRTRELGRGNAREGEVVFIAVPSRPWQGLTVTGVGLHYESTSVYFRESAATVRRVLIAAGIQVQLNGNIPIVNDEAVEGQYLANVRGNETRFGASHINCGV